MQCKWQVEIDPYAQAVLKKHWPDRGRWDDVRTFPPEPAEDWSVDVLCGGFPCQDISVASSTGTGLDGDRSGLWFEYLRVVRTLRPRFVVLENSAAIIIRGLDRILGGLAGSRYDAEWRVFSAFEFGAPHERERAYVVAYDNTVDGYAWELGHQFDGAGKIFRDNPEGRVEFWDAPPYLAGRMDDGLPAGAYSRRGGCIGNAAIPQITEWIGRRLIKALMTNQAV